MITKKTYKPIHQLPVESTDVDLDNGIFSIFFENGRELRCCLVADWCALGDKPMYYTRIDASESGYDSGDCKEVNAWAFEEEYDEILNCLLYWAKYVGVETCL